MKLTLQNGREMTLQVEPGTLTANKEKAIIWAESQISNNYDFDNYELRINNVSAELLGNTEIEFNTEIAKVDL